MTNSTLVTKTNLVKVIETDYIAIVYASSCSQGEISCKSCSSCSNDCGGGGDKDIHNVRSIGAAKLALQVFGFNPFE